MGGPALLREAAHLASRFFVSLWPAGPSRTDTAWAHATLTRSEADLWDRMSAPDRRHSVAVARRVAGAIGARDPTVLSAALLHDVGKVASGLGTFARAAVTVAGLATGRRRAAAWAASRGWRRRAGLYLRHPEEGSAMLEEAGSAPLVVRWAAEHHMPPERWTVARELAVALKAADDD
ncbi:MAG TPA: HD domain-containing protein [Acidimicrobiales bacterium]|nr:HD domain-containing protein [Acidimicrobiales bacterium]